MTDLPPTILPAFVGLNPLPLFCIMLFFVASQGIRAWPWGAAYQGGWKDSLQHGKVYFSED